MGTNLTLRIQKSVPPWRDRIQNSKIKHGGQVLFFGMIKIQDLTLYCVCPPKLVPFLSREAAEFQGVGTSFDNCTWSGI